MDMKICILLLVAFVGSALSQNETPTTSSVSTTTIPPSPPTSAPKTTTTSSPAPPKTTTTPSSTTADPPKTTTPSSTTTAKPTTTTAVPPTTTAKPDPKHDMIVEYNITKKGVNDTVYNCFMGKFKTDLSIKYNATNGKSNEMETGYLTLTDKSSVVQNESSCGENKTVLVILIDNLNGDKLTLTFFNDTKTYALVNVSVFIDPKTIDEHLPNATTLDEKIDSKIVNGNLFSSPLQKSYSCKSNVSKVMDNANKDKNFEVTISMSNVQIDAFRGSDNGKKFRDVQECDADDEFSDVVPIAVGAALAALVIIVLIAYFIGRRRSRQMSYQSV